MANHIHKKFTNEQVKELIQKYLNKEVQRKYIQEILGIGKSRFFEIIQSYRKDPNEFSVDYKRSGKAKRISLEIQENIIKELAIDKKAIQNKDIPLYRYNYSYVQKRLERNHKQSAALSTIIAYAKDNGFYLPMLGNSSSTMPLITFGLLTQELNGHSLLPSMTTAVLCFTLNWSNKSLLGLTSKPCNPLLLNTELLWPSIPIVIQSFVMSEAVISSIKTLPNSPTMLTLNGNKLSKTATSNLSTLYLLKPKVKSKDLTAGFKIISSAPASVKMSKRLVTLNASLTMNATVTTTNNSTLLSKKSLLRDLIPL